MSNRSGFLPYGSDDSSIILQHPFTSDPTTYLESLGTTTKFGAPTFDAELGMKANSATSGGFSLVGLTGGANLDYGYDISFDVETEWLCANNSAIASVGYTPITATQECVISGQSTSLTNFTGWQKDIGGTSSSISYGVSSGSSFSINSQGKNGRFTRVNLGFRGGRSGGTVISGLDGLPYFEKTANAATMSGFLNTLYFGSNRNIANTYCQRYMRNFQISTRPPMFSIHPSLARIGILSDSMFNSDTLISTYADALSSWSMRREFAKRGLYTGTVTYSGTGGAAYSSLAATYLFNTLATVLAANPTILIIRGGTNDASQSLTDDSDWESQVMTYITTAFDNKYVKMIVLPDIPPLIGDRSKDYSLSFVKTGNERLRNVAASWRASNPTDPRKLIVVDVYNAVNALSPPSGTYIGQVNGLYNDLHFTSGGHNIHGRVIAQAIMAQLGDL